MEKKQSGTCHIVGAGDFSPETLKYETSDLIIAADGGYSLLKKWGIPCDLYIGDSDSLGYCPEGIDAIVLPKVKDDTDTLAAVKIGLERGYRRFLLYGALGGKRFSHSVANLSTLLYLDTHGAKGEILDQNGSVSLLNGGGYSPERKYRYFSLFPAGGEALVSISGAKYRGERISLSSNYPMGVSNEGDENTHIEVHSGKVFLILDF